MFWKRPKTMSPEEAQAVIDAADAVEQRGQLIRELAETIHREHLQVIDQMTPVERALLREIRATRGDTVSTSQHDRRVWRSCEDDAFQTIRDREAKL
jgi:hypothetical protein